ncbi:alpha/beta hydrolase [Brevundimonas sp. NIBR11]|uniref:alpha/beta fold hydrolase n=1 Tax=Brevundimonas sp. NIBR11 TaxID=3015999 RepID=UPI0022F1283F|nr:alpha/beta hydrolase [Brevundimonas sp. NIBR11]WGM32104.1 Putative aminoacrylate hydrolase RutD [Brevundimonas sp. NIBR11]
MLHFRHLVGRSTLRALFLASAAALAVGGTLFVATQARGEPAPAIRTMPFVSDRLSVEVIGEGPDVILIPGLASSREVWRLLATRLAATHRVHLVQMAGFAGEPWSHGDGPFVAPAVDELARYVAEAGLEKPAVIGHSMGALLGLRLAQTHPEAVGRLMSVDSLPFFSALYGPTATAETVRPFAEQARAGLLAETEPEAKRSRGLVTAAGMARDVAIRAEIADWTVTSDNHAVASAMADVMTTDARPGLAAMTIPVTALYASDIDGGAPPAMAQALWEREYATLPGVTLIRVDGSRHFIMADQPERFDELVDAFLK